MSCVNNEYQGRIELNRPLGYSVSDGFPGGSRLFIQVMFYVKDKSFFTYSNVL